MMDSALKQSPEWEQLGKHYQSIRAAHLTDLFKEDNRRSEKLTVECDNFCCDLSKNLITTETVTLLIKLAERFNLHDKISTLFTNNRLNPTEGHPVLHTALRDPGNRSIIADGKDILPEIRHIHAKMAVMTEKIRSGTWVGASGHRIKNVVNIGTGGSHLGAEMACRALQYYSTDQLEVFFIANQDSNNYQDVLSRINIEETIFIVNSKSFTTPETLANAALVKARLLNHYQSGSAVDNHMLAVTACRRKALDFGIMPENILEIGPWVGGRFSLASAAGLAVMIMIGETHFKNLLQGMFEMDQHFKRTPLAKNIPVLKALLGIWYVNFYQCETQVIIPYDQHLLWFPVYLQQLYMESNGKCTDQEDRFIDYHTSPVIWGGLGTNSQHAFFQMLHQGTRLIPADFIGFVSPLHDFHDQHRQLLANMFAQSMSLAFGRQDTQKDRSSVSSPVPPHRRFPGNRPSTTLLFSKLTPRTLGQLITLYEHTVFVQGVLWNIFSFDQWGVELGKTAAKTILPYMQASHIPDSEMDGSTRRLINFFTRYFPGDRTRGNGHRSE